MSRGERQRPPDAVTRASCAAPARDPRPRGESTGWGAAASLPPPDEAHVLGCTHARTRAPCGVAPASLARRAQAPPLTRGRGRADPAAPPHHGAGGARGEGSTASVALIQCWRTAAPAPRPPPGPSRYLSKASSHSTLTQPWTPTEDHSYLAAAAWRPVWPSDSPCWKFWKLQLPTEARARSSSFVCSGDRTAGSVATCLSIRGPGTRPRGCDDISSRESLSDL